ncbi:MFS transporter [Bacillus salipaludis]|uniref:MFS transporter n=1 Tax=Bacillus salipaludis TaxID=2547811 RepID=A0ABW8RBY2_9BACI
MNEKNRISLNCEILLSRNALFTLFSLPGFAFANWISRTPEIRDILQASTALMGWIIFGLAAGSMIGLLTASRFIKKMGARFVTVFDTILLIIGLLVIAIASVFGMSLLVFIGLVIFGVGYGSGEVAINVEGTELERKAKKTILPALHACFSAGSILGAALGFICIRIGISVPIHLTVVGIIVFVVLISAYRNIPYGTGKIARTNINGKTIKLKETNVWKEPRTLLIGVIVIGMAFAEGAANDWLPIAMVDGFNVNSSTGTVIYSVFLTAMFIGRVCGGYLLDKFGRVPVLRIAAGIGFLGLALTIFSSNLTIGVIGVFLWGLGVSLGFPVGLSAAGDNPNNSVARVSAVSVLGYAAFLVGPPLLGILGELVGLLNAMIFVLVLLAVAGFVSHSAKELNMQQQKEIKNLI